MPRFSIITCTKNSASTIHETLKSVRAQNFRKFEHIFIDGGSTDGTVEICLNSLNAKVYSKPSLNLYESLNFGLKKCTGEIIFFLHSDDQITQNKLFKNISSLFVKVDTDVIYSNIVMKKNKKLFRVWKSKILRKKDIKNFQFPAHTSFFYKKEIFDKIGYFNTNYKIASDFDHLARLFNDTSIKKNFYNQKIISMNYGGISTKSFTNIIIQNYENILIIYNYEKNFLNILKIICTKLLNRIYQLKCKKF